jgi:hypothetical protein
VYLIVNPVSGGGRAELIVKNSVIPAFNKAGVVVDARRTRCANDAHELARTLPLTDPESDESIDAFVVVGGDGTIHDVINGMLARGDGQVAPIGVVPAGTGNSMMMDFVGCSSGGCRAVAHDPVAAVTAIVEGFAPLIDLNRVTFGPHPVHQTRYSCNLVGYSSDQCMGAVNVSTRASPSVVANYRNCFLYFFFCKSKVRLDPLISVLLC